MTGFCQRGFKIALKLCLLLVFATPLQAMVQNFALLDHKGQYHELYYYENDMETRLIVLYVQGNACPAVRKQIPKLNDLKTKFESQGVRFWMLNANARDSRTEISKEADEYGISWPILKDETQLVAQSLDIKRSAEALVINPRNWTVLYRGSVEKNQLKKALQAGLRNAETVQRKTDYPGCTLVFEESETRNPETISYRKTIAPILLDRCVTCHQQGGLGPFALSSHAKVRGWSQMIREVVMTGRMPPWQADPHYGKFSNDFSLNPDEKRNLVRWIDAGSPKDEGTDPLAAHVPDVEEWPLGKPDLIVEVPLQKIPAQGVVPYRYIPMDMGLKEDVWVRGSHLNPGNTKVLHHVVTTTYMTNPRNSRGGVGGYAPGTQPQFYPADSGRFIKAGTKILFQLHYTVTGKPETDQSRLGLYFYKSPPKRSYLGSAVIDRRIRIPAHEANHVVERSRIIRRDVNLTSMFPHMHFRGKAMRYEVHYPDGTSEVLLSVPNYRFNWQRGYILKEPKRLPRGTRLVVKAAWDNSAQNPFNPDPSKTVRYGLQSWEEMSNAFYSFVLPD